MIKKKPKHKQKPKSEKIIQSDDSQGGELDILKNRGQNKLEYEFEN